VNVFEQLQGMACQAVEKEKGKSHMTDEMAILGTIKGREQCEARRSCIGAGGDDPKREEGKSGGGVQENGRLLSP